MNHHKNDLLESIFMRAFDADVYYFLYGLEIRLSHLSNTRNLVKSLTYLVERSNKFKFAVDSIHSRCGYLYQLMAWNRASLYR